MHLEGSCWNQTDQLGGCCSDEMAAGGEKRDSLQMDLEQIFIGFCDWMDNAEDEERWAKND